MGGFLVCLGVSRQIRMAGKDKKVGKFQEVGDVVCGECGLVAMDNDKGTGCSGCDKWFHIKCAEIDSKLHGAMMKFDSDKTRHSGLHWYCGGCNEGIGKLRLEVKKCMSNVEKEMSSLRKEWDKWKADFKGGDWRTEMNKIMVENKKGVDDAWKEALDKKEESLKRSFSDILKEEMNKDTKESVEQQSRGRRVVRMEVVEELERERRRDKLVIMGIPEEGEDGDGEDIVKDVVAALMEEVVVEFKVIGRIGKMGSKPRPVRIRVQDVGHRRKLLARAKELRNKEGLQKIFIVPDQTRMQQEADKVLRDKVKLLRRDGVEARIVKGEVVRINAAYNEVGNLADLVDNSNRGEIGMKNLVNSDVNKSVVNGSGVAVVEGSSD